MTYEELKRLYAANKIGRRDFLAGAAAVGAVAAASSFPLSGAEAQTPKKGGTLRIAMAHGNTNDNYDPAIWNNAYAQVFATARNGYLTEVAADGSLVGELAESWEASADASVWTLKLRQGVEYHSGKTVTAEDVVASINYHRGDQSTSAAKPIVAPITDIKADGQNVVVTLESGNADFPFIVSDYHLAILPSKDGKIDKTSSDGCGGYKVETYEPGVRAVLMSMLLNC